MDRSPPGVARQGKEFTRLRDEISQARRDLPWERVEKSYTLDGPDGKETLAELFGSCSQLIVYHFMFDPRRRDEEFAKDDPSIILWFRKDLEVHNSALKGFTPTPVITTPFWNPWQLHY